MSLSYKESNNYAKDVKRGIISINPVTSNKTKKLPGNWLVVSISRFVEDKIYDVFSEHKTEAEAAKQANKYNCFVIRCYVVERSVYEKYYKHLNWK